jgi:hypothetical protein
VFSTSFIRLWLMIDCCISMSRRAILRTILGIPTVLRVRITGQIFADHEVPLDDIVVRAPCGTALASELGVDRMLRNGSMIF